MRSAVITAVHGRAQHLRRQLDGISRSATVPDIHVVVAIDDPAVSEIVAACASTAHIVHSESGPGPLPVASARNLGALTAIGLGAELLVFLDVDCIPGRNMLARYHEKKPPSTLNTATHCCAAPSRTYRHHEAGKATRQLSNR